jgi:adhesin/invasin
MRAARCWYILALTTIAVACRDSGTEPTTTGPVAVAQSVVTVSSATVASGDTVGLTLTTKDAQGRALTRGGHTVVFRASGGLSTGSVSPTVDRGNGTYTASFRGIKAGLATTIEASINGEPVTSPLPTVRVRPGPFSPATSIVTVKPRTIVAGGTATIELIARDAAENAHDTGGLRVTLTIGGGSAAGTVGPVTDHANGRYSATFTAAAVGSPLTIGTTVNGTPVTTPPPTVSVARGLSTDLSVLSVSSDTISVDATLRVTFEARDSSGVRRTSGGDTVRFLVQRETSGGDGTVGAVTDHDDGTYSANVTGTRDGLVRIGASINGRAKSAALPSVTILPIPVVPQKSTVSVSADTIEAGKTATFTVLLLDLNGKPVTGAAHRVQFSIGGIGSSGRFGPTTDAGDGKYTTVFTAERAGGSVTVGATVSDSTQIQMLDSLGNSHLPTITVRPGTASADSSLLFADPSLVNVRDSATIRLVTRDSYGNSLDRGGRSVTFARTGGAGVSVGRISSVTDRQDGTYAAYYRADSVGTADAITATLDGRAITSGSPTITVGPACTPGPISLSSSDVTINDTTPAQNPVKSLTLQSGVTTTLTLKIKDAYGCPVTQHRIVTFNIVGGTSTGIIGATADLEDGRYTATFSGHTAGSTSQIAVTIDGTAVTSQAVSVTVIPGDISTRTSIFSASAASALVGDTVTLTLRGRDAAGNLIVRGGRGITFFVVGSQPNGATSSTTDQGNGTYTATYVGARAGTDTIVAIIEGTRVVQAVTVAVQPPP